MACIPFSGSRYQWGAFLPVDFVSALGARGAMVVSVGRNQECVPACCITLRYKLHELLFDWGMIGTYMYGIFHWFPGPIQGALVFPVV
jgi:hypothetical protein